MARSGRTYEDPPVREDAPLAAGDQPPRTGGDPDRGVGAGSAIVALLAFGVAVAIGIGVWSWVDDDTAGPDVGVTVNEIVDDPAGWYGSTVTVSGEVEEVTPFGGDRADGQATGAVTDPAGLAFTIGGSSPGEQLLVIDAVRAVPFLTEDSVVQVTGTVRDFDAGSFNEAYGSLAWFDAGFFDDWNGRPVIVAQSVDPTVPRES